MEEPMRVFKINQKSVQTDKEFLEAVLKSKDGVFGLGTIYYPEHNTDYGDWITVGMPLKRKDFNQSEISEDEYKAIYIGFMGDNPMVGVRRDMEAVRIWKIEIFPNCVDMRLIWEVDFDLIPESAKPFGRNLKTIWDKE
jgi:hypothetical protein